MNLFHREARRYRQGSRWVLSEGVYYSIIYSICVPQIAWRFSIPSWMLLHDIEWSWTRYFQKLMNIIHIFKKALSTSLNLLFCFTGIIVVQLQLLTHGSSNLGSILICSTACCSSHILYVMWVSSEVPLGAVFFWLLEDLWVNRFIGHKNCV